MDHLPRFGKRELIYLLFFTCNYVVSVRRGFLFLWVLVMGCVILLWHSLSLPYNYFGSPENTGNFGGSGDRLLSCYQSHKSHDHFYVPCVPFLFHSFGLISKFFRFCPICII